MNHTSAITTTNSHCMKHRVENHTPKHIWCTFCKGVQSQGNFDTPGVGAEKKPVVFSMKNMCIRVCVAQPFERR